MTTTANGVKVVTHIIPLDEKIESTDLKSSMEEPETAKLPPIIRMFLKGRPLTLGVRFESSFTLIMEKSWNKQELFTSSWFIWRFSHCIFSLSSVQCLKFHFLESFKYCFWDALNSFLKCVCVYSVDAGVYWCGDDLAVGHHNGDQHPACWFCCHSWTSCKWQTKFYITCNSSMQLRLIYIFLC